MGLAKQIQRSVFLQWWGFFTCEGLVFPSSRSWLAETWNIVLWMNSERRHQFLFLFYFILFYFFSFNFLVPLTYVNEENGYCNARACTCQTPGTCNACNTFQFHNFHVLKIKIKLVHMRIQNSLWSWLIWGENNIKYKRFRIICSLPLQSVFKLLKSCTPSFSQSQ